MKKSNYRILGFLAAVMTIFMVSCQKEQIVGGTAVQSLAGEWWVKLDNGQDPTGTFDNSYYTLATYNLASNKPDSMWVDDYANVSPGKPFWAIKGKVGVNVSNRTFSANNIANQDYESTFTITNGKIIPGAATAPGSKVKTDSIYFEIQFSDDPVPGTIHKVGGYARTKWDADDHY